MIGWRVRREEPRATCPHREKDGPHAGFQDLGQGVSEVHVSNSVRENKPIPRKDAFPFRKNQS